MDFPYKVIESKMACRDEFVLTDGYQPTWALFYLKSGSFKLCVNEKKEVVNEGDFVILPNDIRFTRSVLEPIVFVYIKFCPDSKCPYSLNLPFGKFEPADRRRLTDNLLAYEKLIGLDDRRSRSYREHLFRDIIFQIYMEHNPQANDGFYSDNGSENCHDKLVLKAASYIRSHIREKLSIDDICHALGTNQSTLNFKFRRELDCSVGKFIISARMCLAKQLLIGSNYTVSKIAEYCGYENIYYFSTIFKKEIGYSPSEFRNRLQ